MLVSVSSSIYAEVNPVSIKHINLRSFSSSEIFSIAAFLALFSRVEEIKVNDNWYTLTIPNKIAKVLINEFPCMIIF